MLEKVLEANEFNIFNAVKNKGYIRQLKACHASSYIIKKAPNVISLF